MERGFEFFEVASRDHPSCFSHSQDTELSNTKINTVKNIIFNNKIIALEVLYFNKNTVFDYYSFQAI